MNPDETPYLTEELTEDIPHHVEAARLRPDVAYWEAHLREHAGITFDDVSLLASKSIRPNGEVALIMRLGVCPVLAQFLANPLNWKFRFREVMLRREMETKLVAMNQNPYAGEIV